MPEGWDVAQCATTALAGAVPCPCVRGARGRFGGLRPVPGVVSLLFPPSRPACPALRVAGCPVWVSLGLSRSYAIPRGPCVLRARSGCPSGSPRVPFVCVCALALPWCPLRPPLGGVVCAPRAVPALGADRAVPRGPCPSACPAPVPCSVWRARGGGAVWSRFLPTWLGLHALWGLRAAGVVGGRPWGAEACHCCEGRLVSGAVPPPTARPLGRAAGVPRPVCSGCGGCGRGDQGPAPQLAPLQAGVARCGSGGRASPGGAAFHRCEGRLRSGAPPPPTACPLGGLLRPATHVLWARVCGCAGPTLSPWPACPVGAACRRGGGGPSPGGVACHRPEGRLVSGAVPPPVVRPLGRVAGVRRPVCPGCGRCGRGDPAPAPQRAPLRAGVARCGGGGRTFPGGRLPPL